MRIVFALVACLAACTAKTRPETFPKDNNQRAGTCSGGDFPITSSAQCERGDAACYQLPDGRWCTGTPTVRW